MNLRIEGNRLTEINHEATERIVVNQGGTSSGKTYSILIALLIRAQREKLMISVVAESLPHLRRGAMRDFLNILKELGIYDVKNHNRSNNEFTIGQSKIEFFGADQPDKLRGARRDILYINECNNVGYEAYSQLEVRTKKQIFLDFNPVSAFWVHEKVLNQDNVKFIKSTYKDNPFLDQEIIKAIERRRGDDNWWRVYGLGEVGMLEGVIFTNYEVIDEFPDDCKWTCYGLDFGFTHDPTALIQIGRKGDDIYLDEIIYSTGLTNDDIVDKIKSFEHEIEVKEGKEVVKKKVRTYPDSIEIIADSAEPKSIESIRRKGFINIKGAEKGRDSVLTGIDTMQQFKLMVTKDSTNILKEIRNYQWVQTKDGEYINKPIDDWNHAIDAIRYVVSKKCRVDRKSFVDFL